MPSPLLPALAVGTLLVVGTASAGPYAAPSHRGAPGLVRAAAAPSASGLSYVAPLPEPLRVLTPFDPPATPYGPGHLGVDLAADRGEAVRSAGPGSVTFAGPVAGRSVVVVAHPDGIDTEYEPIDPVVRVGEQVAAGSVLGNLDGSHAACAPATCLHWGARRGPTYLDPLDLLGPLGPVRLLPWGGEEPPQARGCACR